MKPPDALSRRSASSSYTMVCVSIVIIVTLLRIIIIIIDVISFCLSIVSYCLLFGHVFGRAAPGGASIPTTKR